MGAQPPTAASPAGKIQRRTFLAAAALALLDATSRAHAQPRVGRTLGVLYAPSARFQPVIDATIRGIEAAAVGIELDRRVLPANSGELETLQNSSVDGWLLLGTEARNAAQRLRLRQPAVTGLQYASPQQAPLGAVSLDFDPEAFLPELKLLLPQRNRLLPVYARARDDWVIDRLRSIAKKYDFSVSPAGAADLREATDHLSGMLRYGNPETDIIWILGGGDLVTDDTSTHLFQQAYNARFPILGGRRAWVDVGALLGGEPDFAEHGAQMVRTLLRMIETGKPGYQLSGKISFALNVRVARRIGILVTDEVRRRMRALVADE
jgi:hypothetical protein